MLCTYQLFGGGQSNSLRCHVALCSPLALHLLLVTMALSLHLPCHSKELYPWICFSGVGFFSGIVRKVWSRRIVKNGTWRGAWIEVYSDKKWHKSKGTASVTSIVLSVSKIIYHRLARRSFYHPFTRTLL